MEKADEGALRRVPLTDAEVTEASAAALHLVGRVLGEWAAPEVQILVNAVPRLIREVEEARKLRASRKLLTDGPALVDYVREHFCSWCGGAPGCQCWNDE